MEEMRLREILLVLKRWVLAWFKQCPDEQSDSECEQGDMSDDWREEEWW
jgi:hypothetical protein